jgi:2-keto-4-pentenoate hydratase/2-oxohepta-3-ene-1,7-dioic acid hydratase in catechol pathway
MKIVRFIDSDEKMHYGWLDENKIGLIEGDVFGEYQRLEPSISIRSIKLLAPVSPQKIICVGRNYVEHATEQNFEIPESPQLFLKPPSAIISNSETILIPLQSHQVEHEAELVVIIGKKGRWIPVEESFDYIFGYSIGNDVTARDIQYKDLQWTRGKGFDTFCPIGPWIETELDPADCLITCRVNGELRQMASTREMVFSVNQIVAYVSTIMTLEPGDVIFTGTPAGIGALKVGDSVEIEIEGIGILQNFVA